MVVECPPPLTNARHRVKLHDVPRMRYTHQDTLVGVVGVKSKLFGVRRRLVRLEHGLLTIRAEEDDYSEPIATVRMCEAHSVDVDPQKSTVSVRATSRAGITLVFKHDIALMQLWSATLKRALTLSLNKFYKLGNQIGEGHYAKVFEGIDRRTGDKVAVKIMPKKQQERKATQFAAREAEIVRSICHKHVVPTFDIFETATHLYVVMEFVEKGTLLSFLAGGKNRVNERNARRIARQLFLGLAYLHDAGIVHRDLKPDNILLSAEGVVKIADFGLARRIDSLANGDHCLSSTLGTPAYCSPEMVSRSQYGKPVDIFGCGVLLYVAISGSLPFRGDTPQAIFEKIATGKLSFPQKRWHMVSKEARQLVASCLSVRPGDRPTARQALNHPWLKCSDDRHVERPVSPVPFIRNGSARTPTPIATSPRMQNVESTRSFRRAQSGSVDDLRRERVMKRNAM
ncbi:unnamed protein product [Agarophyton chilense]